LVLISRVGTAGCVRYEAALKKEPGPPDGLASRS
jgi:hypothetical protein